MNMQGFALIRSHISKTVQVSLPSFSVVITKVNRGPLQKMRREIQKKSRFLIKETTLFLYLVLFDILVGIFNKLSYSQFESAKNIC